MQHAQPCMLNSVLGILWSKCPLPSNLPAWFDSDCCVMWILQSVMWLSTENYLISAFDLTFSYTEDGHLFIQRSKQFWHVVSPTPPPLLHKDFDWNDWVQHVTSYFYLYFIFSAVGHWRWFFHIVVFSWTLGFTSMMLVCAVLWTCTSHTSVNFMARS